MRAHREFGARWESRPGPLAESRRRTSGQKGPTWRPEARWASSQPGVARIPQEVFSPLSPRSSRCGAGGPPGGPSSALRRHRRRAEPRPQGLRAQPEESVVAQDGVQDVPLRRSDPVHVSAGSHALTDIVCKEEGGTGEGIPFEKGHGLGRDHRTVRLWAGFGLLSSSFLSTGSATPSLDRGRSRNGQGGNGGWSSPGRIHHSNQCCSGIDRSRSHRMLEENVGASALPVCVVRCP